MSADLADLKRLKVTAETRAWLAATSRSTGKSQQEIARDAVEIDPYLVLEGDAAGETIRRYFDAAVRAAMAAGDAP